MPDENLVLGFIGGLLAVLGGVWTAYRLLGHAMFRELDQQREQLNMLQNQVNGDTGSLSQRIDREMESRHQRDREAIAARIQLSSRIQHLESEFRRGAVDRQDK